MLRNRLLAEERRLAKMKSTHDIQKESKTIHFSKLVEAEEMNVSSVAVDTEEVNTTIIPVNAKEVNITSELDDRRKTNNVASILDDSERTHAIPMPVDAEETDTVLISMIQ
jgi:hypothetical protein